MVTTGSIRSVADLVVHLVQRDFKLRYTGSLLGILWALALPATQLVVLVFLFQRVIPLGIDAYPAFVLCALLPWNWFSGSVTTAGHLFLNQRDLLRYPEFSPAILVVVNTLSHMLIFLLAVPLLFGILLLYQRWPSPGLLAFPLLLVIQAALIVGISLLVAVVNTYYRDVHHLVGVAVSLGFYLTPIFYAWPGTLKAGVVLFFLNPMVPLVESYRSIFMEGQWPAAFVLGTAAVTSATVLTIGCVVCRRQESEILDAL